MPAIDRLRVLGSPDTNKVMMGELSRLARRALSMAPPRPQKHHRGGLVYPFDPSLALLAIRYQRTATRVLWELYETRASRLEPLYHELCHAISGDSRVWFWDRATVSVRARNVHAFAAGQRQIVGTVKNAIVDGLQAHGATVRVEPSTPDLSIDVRMHDDAVTVSLDLAGTSMSRRGYRTRQGPAPLREHLAAVLCMLTRHDPRAEVLLDPMCGAGTICIEAALLGTAAPHEPTRAPAMWRRIPRLAAASVPDEPLFADTLPAVLGNDIDRNAYHAARDNADDAGVGGSTLWRCGDFRDLSPDRVQSWAGSRGWHGRPGVILGNPPYGQRLRDRDLAHLYRDLGDWCALFKGWRAGFLVAHPHWESHFRRRSRIRKPMKNGPLSCTFYLYDL